MAAVGHINLFSSPYYHKSAFLVNKNLSFCYHISICFPHAECKVQSAKCNGIYVGNGFIGMHECIPYVGNGFIRSVTPRPVNGKRILRLRLRMTEGGECPLHTQTCKKGGFVRNRLLLFHIDYLPRNSLVTFTMFSAVRPKSFSRSSAGPE